MWNVTLRSIKCDAVQHLTGGWNLSSQRAIPSSLFPWSVRFVPDTNKVHVLARIWCKLLNPIYLLAVLKPYLSLPTLLNILIVWVALYTCIILPRDQQFCGRATSGTKTIPVDSSTFSRPSITPRVSSVLGSDPLASLMCQNHWQIAILKGVNLVVFFLFFYFYYVLIS